MSLREEMETPRNLETTAADSVSNSVRENSRWHVLLLTMIASVALFVRLGEPDLLGAREPKAITPARQMLQSGDWLVPRMGNRPRLEKPPVVYWRIAAVGLLTGRVDRWEGRLPSAVEGVLLVLLCYALGRSLLGPAEGLAAACFFIATPTFVFEAREAGPDIPYLCYSTLAVFSAWRCWNSTRRRSQWAFVFLFYVSLSLAAMCKGPFVFVNVIVPILALAAWQRQPALLWKLKPLWGVLIVAAVVLPWPLLLWKHGVDPSAIWKREVSQKLQPNPLKNLQYFLGHIFPWIPLFLGGLVVPFLRRHAAFPRTVWMPWVWFVSSLAGVSVLFSAKANYLLPLLVPASLLTGTCWCGLARLFRERRATWQERLVLHGQIGVLGVGGIVAAAVLAHKFGRGILEPAILAGCFVAAAAVMGALYRRETAGAKATAMLCVTAIGILSVGYLPTIAARREMGEPGRQMVESLKHLPHDVPVYDYVKQCAFVYYHLDHALPWLSGPEDLARHLQREHRPFYLAMQWQLAQRKSLWEVPLRRDATVRKVNVRDWFEEVQTFGRSYQGRPAVVLLRFRGPVSSPDTHAAPATAGRTTSLSSQRSSPPSPDRT